MHLFRELSGLFGAVTQSEGGKHVSFGCDAYSCPASLTAFLIYLFPQRAFGVSYVFAFRIGINLLDDTFNLLQFEINDVIHNALCQAYMLFEQFKIEIGIRFERIHHIRVEVNSEQTAGVVWAQGDFTTWIGRYSAVSQVCITVGYGFLQNGIPEQYARFC